jgi:enoyl-CoA hydratase/carnithine racemase
MTDAVHYTQRDRIGVITLARPDNRNSMTPELLAAFGDAIDQALADPEARVVVITGEGRCFSAGADFKSNLQVQGGDRPLRPHERSFAMYEPFLRVLELQVPVIGALNGHAVGGGFGLALLCDLRFGNRESKYGANFARLGFHSGLGISYVLPRIVGAAHAADLLFTGRLVRGDEAERMGLLTATDPEAVLPTAMARAAEVASAAPYAVRTMKKSLRRYLAWDVREAAWEEAFAQAESLATEDAAEGIAALLEKREPSFTRR